MHNSLFCYLHSENKVDVTEITRETYDLIASGYAQRIHDLVSDTWIDRFEKSLLDKLVTLVILIDRVAMLGLSRKGSEKETGRPSLLFNLCPLMKK